MPEIDVFVSYKREERALADKVTERLASEGYVAVTDLNIQKAVDFGDAIDSMIAGSKLVVVLWTGAAAQSHWVRKEAQEAERLGKYLGVRVDKIEPEDLPLAVRNSNWIDASEAGLEQSLPGIIQVVRELIGPPKFSAEMAKEESTSAGGDLEFFQVVDSVGEPEGYQSYLATYPAGTYSDVARRRLKERRGWWSQVKRFPFISIFAASATVFGGYATIMAAVSPPAAAPSNSSELQQALSDLESANSTIQDRDGQLANLNDQLASMRSELTSAENARNVAEATLERLQASAPLGEATDFQALGLQLAERGADIVVAGVTPGSDSEAKGMMVGDVIFELSSQRINSIAEVDRITEEVRERGALSILVLRRRDGEPRFVALSVYQDHIIGLRLDARANGEIVVSNVLPGSDAEERGMQVGDIITEVGQQPVASVREIFDLVEAAIEDASRQSILFLIRRDGWPRFVAVSLE